MTTEAQPEGRAKPEPQSEHRWLQKLVGEWAMESEATMGPDESPVKFSGTESVRSIGDVWVLAEGQGVEPDGGPMTTLTTLGFDPQRNRFVGTFVGSMMTFMWVYEGTLDADERVLTLDCEGPKMSGEGMAKYRDIIEFESDDHRLLRAEVQGDDGQWQQFMVSHYWRQK